MAEAMHSVLQPVMVTGLAAGVPVRWQVDLPADHIAVVTGTGAALDYHWALHGWLLAPE